MKKLLVALALFFVSVSASAIPLLPCDGTFESGNIATCFPRNQSPATTISTIQSLSPTHALKFTPGVDSTGNTNVLIGDRTTVYFRFSWWIPSTINTAAPTSGRHAWRLTRSGPANDFQGGQVDSYLTGPSSSPTLNVDLFDDTGFEADGPYHNLFQLPTNQWFQLEGVFVMNGGSSSNGTMKFCRNGSLVYSNTAVKYKNSGASLEAGWNIWNQVTNYDTSGAESIWYMDNVYVSNVDESGGCGGDTKPPIISLPTVGSVTSSGGIPTFTTDELNGTRYLVVVLDAEPAPNATQIKLGQRSTGGAAIVALNGSVIAPNLQTFTALTTLNANTAYDVYYVQTDASGNNSNVIKADLQTSAVSATSECPANWAALHPEWIWCDDFETDKFTSYFEADASFARVAGAGLNGTVSRRASFTTGVQEAGGLKLAFGLTPPGAGFTQPAGVNTTTKFREVYYRLYLKSAANWSNPSNPNNSKLSRAMVVVDSSWSQAAIGHLWSDQSANTFLLSDPASCVTGSTVNCIGYNDFAHLNFLGSARGTTAVFAAPNLGNYVCVEHHVKLNDAGQTNGMSEFWVNDTLNASQTNLNYVGSYSAFGINGIFFENFINNGSPQNQIRDWDNIIVSTQRIGCTIFGGGATQPTHRLPFRIRP